MSPRSLPSARAVVCCTALVALLTSGVNAQSTGAASICPRGTDAAPVTLSSADKHTMLIYCEEAGQCIVQHTVFMDELASTTLCVPSNGTANTIKIANVVQEQDEASSVVYVSVCSPVVDDAEVRHPPGDATFLNNEAQAKWQAVRGRISTISICGDPSSDVLVCGSGTPEAAKNGEPQLCGEAGIYQAVYTGQDARSTNGCNGNDVLLYFTIIGAMRTPYYMYKLSFDEPVVTSVVSLGGQQQTVTGTAGSGSADVSVSITMDAPNPLTGRLLAYRETGGSSVVEPNRAVQGSCTGYCAFQRRAGSLNWLPLPTECAGATPGCQGASCDANVQLFQTPSTDITLPATSPSGSVQYSLTSANRVQVSTSGSELPLKGVFVFNRTAEERVTPSGAARDLSSATAHVLPQDAQHKDVVVVRAGGEVVAASKACEFALRRVRGTDRMYSVTNVLGEPTCDLVIGNGVGQQSFTLSTAPKDAGAREVNDYDALWDEADKLDEGDGKNVALILGLTLGLGIPALLAIGAVIGLFCCRRRKKCCFAENTKCPAWLTKWSRRATDCCVHSSPEENEAPKPKTSNPLERKSSLLEFDFIVESEAAPSKVESREDGPANERGLETHGAAAVEEVKGAQGTDATVRTDSNPENPEAVQPQATKASPLTKRVEEFREAGTELAKRYPGKAPFKRKHVLRQGEITCTLQEFRYKYPEPPRMFLDDDLPFLRLWMTHLPDINKYPALYPYYTACKEALEVNYRELHFEPINELVYMSLYALSEEAAKLQIAFEELEASENQTVPRPYKPFCTTSRVPK